MLGKTVPLIQTVFSITVVIFRHIYYKQKISRKYTSHKVSTEDLSQSSTHSPYTPTPITYILDHTMLLQKKRNQRQYLYALSDVKNKKNKLASELCLIILLPINYPIH